MDTNTKQILLDKVNYYKAQYLISQGVLPHYMDAYEICILFLLYVHKKTKVSNFDLLIEEAYKISNNSEILHNFVSDFVTKKFDPKNDFINGAISVQNIDDKIFKECASELRENMREATPQSVGELVSKLLKCEKGKVIDAYSGFGFFDIDFLNENPNCQIDGYEISEYCVECSRLINLIMGNNVNYSKEDLLKIDLKSNYYDRAFADTPFGLRYNKESLNLMGIDLFIKNNTFSIPWISAIKILASLNKEGKAIITTTEASLYNVLDREIRLQFVEKNYISRIIKLSPNLLLYSGIPIYLIMLDKNKKDELIRFCDVSENVIVGRRKNKINVDEALNQINNNSITATKEEIQKNDYSLDLNRYLNKDKIKVENGIILEDVAEIFRGYQITASQVDSMITENEKESNYKLLEIGNVDNEGNIDKQLKCINTGKKNLDKFLLRDGDIVLSARGENTKIAIVNINKDECIVPNGSIVVIRTNMEKLDSRYLKMFLNSKQGQFILKTVKTGLVIPSINIGPLGKIEVKCPSMEEQQRLIEKYSLKYELYKATTEKMERLKQQLDDITNEI